MMIRNLALIAITIYVISLTCCYVEAGRGRKSTKTDDDVPTTGGFYILDTGTSYRRQADDSDDDDDDEPTTTEAPDEPDEPDEPEDPDDDAGPSYEYPNPNERFRRTFDVQSRLVDSYPSSSWTTTTTTPEPIEVSDDDPYDVADSYIVDPDDD